MSIGELEIRAASAFEQRIAGVVEPEYGSPAVQAAHLPERRERDFPSAVESGREGEGWMLGIADPNPEMQSQLRYAVYRDMRSDAACRSALWMFKFPARGGQWEIRPGANGESTDPVDLAVAQFFREQFGIEGETGWMDRPWSGQLNLPLLMLDNGAMFGELIDGEPRLWRDPSGDEHLVLPLAQIAPRYPSTLDPLDGIKVKAGRITELRQSVIGARPIPGERVVPFVLEREGSEPHAWLGTSLLRAMVGPWKLKKTLMLSAAIGWDRFSSGFPEIRYPVNAGAAAEEKARRIGRSIRSDAQQYVVFEGSEDQGWLFKLHQAQMNDPTAILRFFNEEIAQAGMQNFMRLGTTASGSRALGEVLIGPFYLALESFAAEIAETYQHYVMRRLVDINFGERVETPQLRVSKLRADDLETMAKVLPDLTAAGLSFTDHDTQNALRERLRLPMLPDDVGVESAFVQREGDGLNERILTVAEGQEERIAAGVLARLEREGRLVASPFSD